jgi:hypothetical protein
MNRLLPGAMPAPAGEPAHVPSQGADPIPGSKPHLQAQARQLGVATRGTKADIWGRISTAQAANVGRRVRAPREAGNRLLMASEPAAVEQPDPFTDALSRFEAFMGAR